MKEINCIICGSGSYLKLFRSKDRLLKVNNEQFQVVKCKECGMVYLNPQPTPEEITEYYPADYSPYISQQVFKDSQLLRLTGKAKQIVLNNYPQLSEKLKRIKRSASRNQNQSKQGFVPSSDSDELLCLDFGCGNGRHMENLQKEHPRWEISGLDNSPIACEAASAKGFKVYCGDASQVDLPKCSFDRVYMNSVIEHLHDPRRALQVINSTLKMGGNLKVMTPNISSFGARLFRQYWHALDTPRHLYLFDQTTLNTILDETGFEIQSLDYKKGMSVEIKSFYHLMKRFDRRMNPIIWQLSVPIGDLLARFGQASTIIANAKKVREA